MPGPRSSRFRRRPFRGMPGLCHHDDVLALAFAMVLPTLAMGALIVLPKLGGVARRRRSRRAAPTPAWPPIERLAADLRRLRPMPEDSRRSRVQREGARLAYLDLIIEACERLDVPQDLRSRYGLAREAELMRVEAALAAAGLDVRDSGDRAA